MVDQQPTIVAEKIKDPAQSLVRERLDYDQITGLLIWKARAGKRWEKWNEKNAGQAAGYFSDAGYIRIYLGGRINLAHRLAWIHVNGPISGMHIDHINGHKRDNRVENLRLVTLAENSRNRKIQAGNKSGVTGVYWYKPDRLWRANITFKKRRIHIGYFHDLNEAISARKAAEQKYGFHENHGRIALRAGNQGESNG